MTEQVVFYHDEEGKIRVRGGDPNVEAIINYDNGVKVNYIYPADTDIEQITTKMKKVRLTEKEKQNMPDKYKLNEKTGKMVLKKLSEMKI